MSDLDHSPADTSAMMNHLKEEDQKRRSASAGKAAYDESARMISDTSYDGSHEIAEKIIQKARAADIPIHDSPDLVSLLIQLDLHDQVPSNMYRALAEILTWMKKFK